MPFQPAWFVRWLNCSNYAVVQAVCAVLIEWALEVLSEVKISLNVCGLLQLLACALDSVFEVLDCADDVFALGSTSNIVAAELASLSWAKTRRRVRMSFTVGCHYLLFYLLILIIFLLSSEV